MAYAGSNQLEKLEQEKKDLQRELDLLENAQNPEESAKRIIDYIASQPEPLTDPNNPVAGRGGCCQIL